MQYRVPTKSSPRTVRGNVIWRHTVSSISTVVMASYPRQYWYGGPEAILISEQADPASEIHLRPISQKIPQISIAKMC